LLGVSAAIVVTSYIVATLIALFTGSADFSLPLKATLAFTIFLLFYGAFDDLRQALMVRTPRVIPRLQSLILLVVGYVAITAAILEYVASSSFSTSLRLNPIISTTVAAGLIPPAIFSVVEFYRAGELIRRAIHGRK
jgi:hypothetical protein